MAHLVAPLGPLVAHCAQRTKTLLSGSSAAATIPMAHYGPLTPLIIGRENLKVNNPIPRNTPGYFGLIFFYIWGQLQNKGATWATLGHLGTSRGSHRPRCGGKVHLDTGKNVPAIPTTMASSSRPLTGRRRNSNDPCLISLKLRDCSAHRFCIQTS